MKVLITFLAFILFLTSNAQRGDEMMLASYAQANPIIPLTIDQGNLVTYSNADYDALAVGANVVTIEDLKGSNGGTASNITMAGTAEDKFYDFGITGSPTYVQLANGSDINFLPNVDAFSVMFVVKTSGVDTSVETMATKGTGTDPNRQYQFFSISRVEQSRFFVVVGGSIRNFEPTNEWRTDTLVHTLIFTISSGGAILIYIDGVSISTPPALTGTVTSALPWVIGALNHPEGTYVENYDHDMKAWAFWNKVLTQSEITAIDAEF